MRAIPKKYVTHYRRKGTESIDWSACGKMVQIGDSELLRAAWDPRDATCRNCIKGSAYRTAMVGVLGI